MKHIATIIRSQLFRVLALCTLITTGFWYIFPDVRSGLGGVLVFACVFGFVNIMIASEGIDRNLYRSLIFPKLLPFSFLIATTNLLLFGGAAFGLIFLLSKGPIVSFQTPFLFFAVAVIILACLWWVAASKLTPKSGTMVVDEETDLYYLPGDVFPRLLSRVQIITPETKIPVSVSAPILNGPTVTVSQSFYFSAWVFTQEARKKLRGSMCFNTIINGAKGKLYSVLAEKVKTLTDIEKFFEPEVFPVPKKPSPYKWNDDLTVSVRKLP